MESPSLSARPVGSAGKARRFPVDPQFSPVEEGPAQIPQPEIGDEWETVTIRRHLAVLRRVVAVLRGKTQLVTTEAGHLTDPRGDLTSTPSCGWHAL